MNCSWDWYRVFYYVATESQISKAALKLNISQPAVSQSIKLLEEYIGFSLFIRRPKGVQLTPSGELLFKDLQLAFYNINSMENKINELTNSNNGEIKIGASDTLCSHFLLPFLKEFKFNNPLVKIHIFNMTTDEITISLESGKIDLGFINLPYKLNDKITFKEIEKLQDCFICGSKYRKYFKNKVSLCEIIQHPLILLEEGTNMRSFINDYFLKNNIECLPELELGSVDLLTKFTRDNFGVSFVTKNFVKEELANKEIFVIDVEEEIPKRGIGIIKMKDTVLTNTVNNFYNKFI